MHSPVSIVGGGIAGLTTALALNQTGITTQVFERGNFEDNSGAGIQLTPNATNVLFQLGLKSELVAVAHEVDELETRHWRTGKVLRKIALRNVIKKYSPFPYLQILRSELINILHRRCEQQSSISLFPNTEVQGLEQTEHLVHLSSSQGMYSAAMVVGTDGTHSTVSKLIGNHNNPKFSGWHAWRTVLTDPSLRFSGLKNTNVWCGPNGHIVHYPVNSVPSYNCVFVTKSPEPCSGKWKQVGSVSDLKAYFHGWHSDIIELIDQINQDSLFQWGLFRYAQVPNSWHCQRVVLVGDSIHTTMPFLAQGAALAIEDAYVLAKRMKMYSVDIPRVIASFVQSRHKRVKQIQARSEKMGLIYHVAPPWSWIRDVNSNWAVNRLAKSIYSFEVT